VRNDVPVITDPAWTITGKRRRTTVSCGLL